MDELCLDFMNTARRRPPGKQQDILENPALLLTYLSGKHILIHKMPDAKTLKALRDMRDFLLSETVKLAANQPLSQASLSRLNLYLSFSPCVRKAQFINGKYEIKLEPFVYDWNWLLAELAVSFLRLLGNEAGRIRICENPSCRRVFCDGTKNKTKRCCCEACANLMKVRRYRERHRRRPTSQEN